MTIDDAIEDALGKTSPKSGLIATYAIRCDAKFFGYVEAHLNMNGSTRPQDWEITWIANWQNAKGKIETATSEDLESLLKPLGNVDLAPAWGHAPWSA